MNVIEYALFILSVISMIATPGPVMILVASAGLQGGYRQALYTIIGTNLASLVLISISILLLKGVVSVDAWLFDMIRLLGCLYIAYLGYEILKEVKLNQSQEYALGILQPVRGGMRKGFLVGISNPKDIIFFSAFFPQFVGIHPNINTSLIVLVITWILLDFLTLSVAYLSFRKLAKTRYYSGILCVCGLILLIIAVYGIWSVFGSILFAGQ